MIDLHIHTVRSDGDFTVEEILEKAQAKNLDIISITDHNNIRAYDDLKLLDVSKLYNGKIVAGTELEFVYNGRLFDMLGYGFDVEKLKQTEIIKKGYEHSTIEGQTQILNFLKGVSDKLGIKYDSMLKIPTPNYMANDVLVDNILEYPENKEILDKMGIVDRSSFYRKHFCEITSPFYYDQTAGKEDIFYVTSKIHEAGGKCFLAHPFVYHLDNIEEIMNTFVSYGIIDGIECFHRKHSPEQIEYLCKYCDKNNLLKSGGSDFHIESHCLGYANKGNVSIPNDLVDDWIYEFINDKDAKHY